MNFHKTNKIDELYAIKQMSFFYATKQMKQMNK